jgi:hypothetical protein
MASLHVHCMSLLAGDLTVQYSSLHWYLVLLITCYDREKSVILDDTCNSFFLKPGVNL